VGLLRNAPSEVIRRSSEEGKLEERASGELATATYPNIADYGIIGAMRTCALVSKAGSIDWLCLPDFDSPSVFGRILDWHKGGYFQVAPRGVRSVDRRYLPETNILETTFQTETGKARLTDFMPVDTRTHRVEVDGNRVQLPKGINVILSTVHRHRAPTEGMLNPHDIGFHSKVLRILECVEGSVEFTVECRPRFAYGAIVPLAALIEESEGISQHGFARGGGNAISVYCSKPLSIKDRAFYAEGSLESGEKLYSALVHQTFFLPAAEEFDGPKIERLLEETSRYWKKWAGRCTYKGEYRNEVLRSALALKTLTYDPSGALLAAATTSLPETPAGERNWDYRFTWLRDATFSLEALHNVGYTGEARGFKRWLEWTAAYPEDLQIMYGLRGERWLTEVELPLEGYRWSRPVRIGNAAHEQFQLDIYGEILDAAYIYRKIGGPEADPEFWEFESEEKERVVTEPEHWDFLCDVIEFVIKNWRRPDAGIWETRGGYRHFVFSKVMCWVALDRGVKIAEELRNVPEDRDLYNILDEDIHRWKEVREEIRADVLTNGYDSNYRVNQGAFVQSYGSKNLDASALVLPLVGFIKVTDPRMQSTIEAIRRDLVSPEGFVYRYKGFDDGLEGGEGSFTICTFWLVNNLIALGEIDQAKEIFEMLLAYANDLGLLSEEINTETGEMLGNFPQAFSHLALIDCATALARAGSSAEEASRSLA
jgi:GH15 family glucan-1,4-alpha-glucosidase